MREHDLTHTLTELAARADVTPRTVRYYIAQGLVPGPLAQGPGAHYTDGHLARIRLIKRLQREHLPLAEIRARLRALGDDQVRDALGDVEAAERRAIGEEAAGLAVPLPAAAATPVGEPVQPPTAAAGASALSYIRRVLREGSDRGPASRSLMRSVDPLAAGPPVPAPGRGSRASFGRDVPDEVRVPFHAPAPDAGPHAPEPPSPASWPSTAPAPGERSTWERIALTADLELHVRRPLDRSTNRRLERLLAYARELLDDRTT